MILAVKFIKFEINTKRNTSSVLCLTEFLHKYKSTARHFISQRFTTSPLLYDFETKLECVMN